MAWTNDKPGVILAPVLAVDDNFQRANTTEPNLGSAPRGGPWILRNGNGVEPPTRGRILNNLVVSSVVGSGGNFYATLADINRKPIQLTFKGRWDTAGGSGGAPFFGTGFAKSLSPYVVYNAIYSRWYRNSVTLDVFQDGNMNNLQQVTYSDLATGTVHTLVWKIDPYRGVVKLYVNGSLKITVSTAAVIQYLYQIPFFQLSYPASDSTCEGKIAGFSVATEGGWANDVPQRMTI